MCIIDRCVLTYESSKNNVSTAESSMWWYKRKHKRKMKCIRESSDNSILYIDLASMINTCCFECRYMTSNINIAMLVPLLHPCLGYYCTLNCGSLDLREQRKKRQKHRGIFSIKFFVNRCCVCMYFLRIYILYPSWLHINLEQRKGYESKRKRKVIKGVFWKREFFVTSEF